MKQHPDRQPRRAITVNRGDDDDRQADQNFEGDWIDNATPLRIKRKEREVHRKERKVATFNPAFSLRSLRNPLRPLR